MDSQQSEAHKINKGKTHSKPATKILENLCNWGQLVFCEERGQKFLFEKSPTVQTFVVSFCKPLFNFSALRDDNKKQNSEMILL